MKIIDISFLETFIKNKASGRQPVSSSTGLITQARRSIYNFYNKIITFNSFEVASICKTLGKWEQTNKTASASTFAVRDIVMVDLGLGYGYELSYEHPCIILYHSTDGFFLAVPCSTGKYNKISKYILKGTASDGFKNNTGVLIDSIRAISKTRISHKVGEITPAFLDYINQNLLKYYLPKEHLNKRNLERDLIVAKETIENLQKQLEELKSSDNDLELTS